MDYSSLSPKGFLLDCGGSVIAETLQCCHCGAHFEITPGSGKVRGFCTRCGKVTCGSEKCDACVPTEQWLENVEAGRPEDYRPIHVAVPDNPLGNG